MTRDELIDAYQDWLSKYHWSLVGSLTFPGSPSFSKADRIFRRWISEMREMDGADDFRWVRVTEYDSFGDNIHFHFVAGGLRNGSRLPWMFRWDELAGGSSLMSYYNHSAGGLRYMLKTADPDRDFEIDMELPPTTTTRRR